MAELVACYERHMTQARLLRIHMSALLETAGASSGDLSGFDHRDFPPDTTTGELRNIVARLLSDPDVSLDAS
jgi:hypothetical protein